LPLSKRQSVRLELATWKASTHPLDTATSRAGTSPNTHKQKPKASNWPCSFSSNPQYRLLHYCSSLRIPFHCSHHCTNHYVALLLAYTIEKRSSTSDPGQLSSHPPGPRRDREHYRTPSLPTEGLVATKVSRDRSAGPIWVALQHGAKWGECDEEVCRNPLTQYDHRE